MSQNREGNMPTYEKEKYDYRISYDNLASPKIYGQTALFQLGRLYCNRHTKIPVHTQLNYVELTVATDGRATVFTNGDGVEIEAGDIYVSFAGDFHAISPDTREPLKYDFITFRIGEGELSRALEKIMADHHAASARVIRDRSVARLVSDAIREMSDPDEYSDRVMEALLFRMAVGVIRAFGSNCQKKISSEIGEEKMLCLRLMNYIDNHIYTLKSLNELTSITNYTYNYTSNLFKRVTGDTLVNYYRNRRLEAATLFLKSGEYSIGEVAEMLNYSSIYSFSLAYKKKYGYPPTSVK